MHYEGAESPSMPGFFAVIRKGPGVDTVECDGFEYRRRADQVASSMTDKYRSCEAKAITAATAERHIPRGFYTDADAA